MLSTKTLIFSFTKILHKLRTQNYNDQYVAIYGYAGVKCLTLSITDVEYMVIVRNQFQPLCFST